MRKVALIVAGGKGTRMKNSIPKQFLLLNNFPILMHTLKQFAHFEKTFLVLPKSEFDYWRKLCISYNFNQEHILIEGGESRFQSVRNGLKKIDDNTAVAIHDGVRPLVSKDVINRLINKTKNGVGVVPVLPVKNSIRKIEGDISVSINRNNLHKVQTPQCFLSSNIQNAYRQKYSTSFTDDASVFESSGGKIIAILGEEKNFKITTKKDLLFAQLFNQ